MNQIVFAKIISILLNPVVLLFAIVTIIKFNYQITLIQGLSIIPFALSFFGFVIYKVYIKKEADYEFTKLSSRKYLGITMSIGIIISSIILYSLRSDLTPYLLKALFIILISGFITLFWKISFHAIGLFAFIGVIYREINLPIFWIFIFVSPLLFWARIKLKKHTLANLLAGAILGLITII